MAVSLKVLPSIGTRSRDGVTSPELGFPNFPASNCFRFGSDFIQQKKKKKIGEKFKLVKAVVKVDETSSFHYIYGQADPDFINGFPNRNGKSTLACALSHSLHSRGKLTYVLDGDNIRHGLNKNLSFGAEDRAENIRRVGEVAKLFADAGVICIASLISPYRKDRDACRALLQKGDFIEVFMDVPLQLCEARDPKGLYKLARAGKIKGFTGVDDPYERPLNCEIVLQQKPDTCTSPCEMAEIVVSYLEEHGYLQA